MLPNVKLFFQPLLVENPFVCMSLCFPNNSLLVFGPALLGWWMLSNEVPVKCMMQGVRSGKSFVDLVIFVQSHVMSLSSVYGWCLLDFWVVVSNVCYFHPYLGEWSNLTNIFQMGWNHQLDLFEGDLLEMLLRNITTWPFSLHGSSFWQCTLHICCLTRKSITQ